MSGVKWMTGRVLAYSAERERYLVEWADGSQTWESRCGQPVVRQVA